MIGRALWIVAVSAAAVVTAQLQLDRQSARDPAFAEWVAAPFRANAQYDRTIAALATAPPAAALAEAQRLVARRPVPAENLMLLSSAFNRAGDAERASLAVQYAAQRGWRDPYAQQVRLGLALEAGDEPEAARRYVALLLNPDSDTALLAQLGEQVLARPSAATEQALIDLVSDTDRWHAVMLRRGPLAIPSDTFAAIIAASARRGARFDCALLLKAAATITKNDAASGARLGAVHAAQCPSS
jgi:hypothetical protein